MDAPGEREGGREGGRTRAEGEGGREMEDREGKEGEGEEGRENLDQGTRPHQHVHIRMALHMLMMVGGVIEAIPVSIAGS